MTEELQEAICKRLADGESLIQICRDNKMPSRDTVMRWQNADAQFAARCARAREMQADYMDHRIGDVIDRTERGALQPDVARVVLSGLQWRAAKLAPKKYGDKNETTLKGDPESPLKSEMTVRFVRPNAE